MINYRKYLRALEKANFSELRCAHCGAVTRSANGKRGICNFCEQAVGGGEERNRERPGPEEFQRMQDRSGGGTGKDALADLERLLEKNQDPETFYISALFYQFSSDSSYRSKNYALSGFMEGNYASIRGSLDLASKWKECFYRAASAAAGALEAGSPSRELLYIRFMSEVKLHRLTDASRALGRLTEQDSQDPILVYANMVYGVRARTLAAELRLSDALKTNEANAFYYLAEHLARNGRLVEASKVLAALGQKADVRMSAQLLATIMNVQSASEM